MFAKIKSLIKDQLLQGSSADKLAHSLSLGIVMGCCPVIGISTAIAALLTHFLKLNHVVVQTANYAMYPIQIPLIPVYLKLVSWVTDVGFVPLRPDLIIQEFKISPELFLRKYSLVALYAVLIWLLACLALVPILSRILVPMVARLRFTKTPLEKP